MALDAEAALPQKREVSFLLAQADRAGGSFRCNHALRPARPLSLGVRRHGAIVARPQLGVLLLMLVAVRAIPSHAQPQPSASPEFEAGSVTSCIELRDRGLP